MIIDTFEIHRPEMNCLPCFICNKDIIEAGVNLASSQTSRSRVLLPQIISQIIGDEFCVFVSKTDRLCGQCARLVNYVDELEEDLQEAKNELMGRLNAKYSLNEEEGTPVKKPYLMKEELQSLQRRCLKCNLCEYSTNSQQDLLLHLDTHERINCNSIDITNKSGLLYKCSVCEKSFSLVSDCVNHITKQHSDLVKGETSSEYSCKCCKAQLDNIKLECEPSSAVVDSSKEMKMSDSYEFKEVTELKTSISAYNKNRIATLSAEDKKYTLHNSEYKSNINSKLKFFADSKAEVNPKFSEMEAGGNKVQCATMFHVEKNNLQVCECSSCGFKSQSRETVRSHITMVHSVKISSTGEDKVRLMCLLCETQFESKELLDQHNLLHVSEPGSDFVNKLIEAKRVSEKMVEKTCEESKIRGETPLDNYDLVDSELNNNSVIPTAEVDRSNLLKIRRSVYLCALCGFKNSSIEIVKKHYKTHGNYSCDHCGAEFSLKSHLKKHILIHLKESNTDIGKHEYNTEASQQTQYKCSKCDYKNNSIDIVKKHYKLHVSYSCHYCDTVFTTITPWKKHMDIHESKAGQPPVVCSFCPQACHDVLHLRYHVKEKHDILKNTVCVICDEEFPDYKMLKLHKIAEHVDVRGKYECQICGRTFKREKSFFNHRQYGHSELKCRICDKQFQDEKKLRQHEYRHARLDRFQYECNVCQRRIKSRSGLRVHMAAHTNEYNYFCEFCGRGFMSPIMLEEHKGTHTKEERYICDICGRRFVMYSTYNLHRRWHISPFPFGCRICKKKFRYRSERSNHVRRVHTGEKPYKCTHCPASFFKLPTLQNHVAKHTNEWRFYCPKCNRGFMSQNRMAVHLKNVHKDPSLWKGPRKVEFKVMLRPDEFPNIEEVCDGDTSIAEEIEDVPKIDVHEIPNIGELVNMRDGFLKL